MYFLYGEKETEYLKSKDKKLGEAIEKLGHIDRPVETDLFWTVVNSIIGQQISTAAHKTITRRMFETLSEVTPETIFACPDQTLQSFGMTFRKVEYIKGFAEKVQSGELDLEALYDQPDEEVIRILCELKGIGAWTAEMIMTFCMQRPDIVSYGDLAILRGMRMLYHHKKIDKRLFQKYKKRYSPYGSVASIYLWAISGGAIEGMKDYAPKKGAAKK